MVRHSGASAILTGCLPHASHVPVMRVTLYRRKPCPLELGFQGHVAVTGAVTQIQ